MTPGTKRALVAGGIGLTIVGALALLARKASAADVPSKGGEKPAPVDPGVANCTGRWVSEVPPAEVQYALNPDGIGAGGWTKGPVYANQKGILWRFSNPMGYARCSA